MNRAYWDAVADDYERAVLSVFDHDTVGLVRARIAAAGAVAPHARAADLGCGIGKFLQPLATAFSHVEACDCSHRSLAAARLHDFPRFNVRFHQLDLTCDPVPFAPVDFALCVNVLIMPSLDQRLRAWRTVTNQVAHGGTLLLVVPSLESVQLGNFRMVEDCLREGDSCADAIRRCTPENALTIDLLQGVHPLDGLPTKHYLAGELEGMLPDHQFDVVELVKLEYNTPGAEDDSCAWDWLVLARRR